MYTLSRFVDARAQGTAAIAAVISAARGIERRKNRPFLTIIATPRMLPLPNPVSR